MLFDLSLHNDKERFKQIANEHFKNGKKVKLTTVKEKRTIKQNSYVHVVFTILGKEIGYELEEIKTILKREYGLVYEKNGHKFLRSTTDLDTKEMSDFTEWLILFGANMGLIIPTPEEYLKNQFEINKQYNI